MTYRDGDVLMLTSGPLAGDLVFVSLLIIDDWGRPDPDTLTDDMPFFCDQNCYERQENEDAIRAVRTVIHNHNIFGGGEFPFHCVKIGRWK